MRRGIGIVMLSKEKSMSSIKTVVLAGLIIFAATGVAQAVPFTFNASDGSGDDAVSATATITPGAGQLTVVLTNTLPDPRSAGNLLSDISLTLNTLPGVITLASQLGSLIDINVSAGGTFTSHSGDPTHWDVELTGPLVIHLTTLTGGQPENLIIGPPDSDTGRYDHANSSVDNFNPSIQGTGTFVINATGVTSNTIVTAAVFSFGTSDTERLVTGVPDVTPTAVPQPMTLLLLGSGFIGIVGLGRSTARSRKTE